MKSKAGIKILTIGLILSAALLSVVSLVLHGHSSGENVLSWQRRSVADFRHETGYAYQAPLGRVWMSSHNGPSPAQLFENGVLLGPANSMHDDIRNIGKGRFSFWYDTLYFSASDNSDPNNNGERYEILWPTPVNPVFLKAVYAATLIAIFIAALLIISILRKGREDAGSILLVLRYTAITGILYLAYLMCYRPSYLVSSLSRCLMYGSAYFICGFLGFQIGRVLHSEIKLNILSILRAAALLMVAIFILLRPETGNWGFAALSKGKLALSVFALKGFVVFYIFRVRNSGLPSFLLLPRKEDRLKTLILVMIVIAIPQIIKPLTTLWDTSGWMDSKFYDYAAHRIATGQAPQGDSFVMPLYQYGLAFFYYIFGHFFYVQQIVNALMLAAIVVLLCLTAWNLFRSLWAVSLAGILAAFTTEFYGFAQLTQIENWYIPLICLMIFMWSCYLRNPNLPHLVFLAFSIGLGFNMRLQGAPFFAFFCAIPFFVYGLSMKRRILHTSAIIGIVFLTMLPWSVRNYLYEDNFSFGSAQGGTNLLLNDHRLEFYGINYLKNWNEVVKECVEKYPDPGQRIGAMRKDYIRDTFSDPAWLSRAVFWRTLSLYGILPSWISARGGAGPQDWRRYMSECVQGRFSAFFFIVISLLGFVIARNRIAFALLLGILSSASITVFATTNEWRYSLPIIPLHIMLGLCVFFEPAVKMPQSGWSLAPIVFSAEKKKYWAISAYSLFLLFALCHFTAGREYAYRPLLEKTSIDSHIKIDDDTPLLNQDYDWKKYEKAYGGTRFRAGEKVRLTCRATNYMLPPKTYQSIPYIPAFASDPMRETFYYGYNPATGQSRSLSIPIVWREKYVPITYFGAAADCLIREDDLVEVEARIIFIDKNSPLAAEEERNNQVWLKAEKVRRIKAD